jgi:hypothetical protein
MHLFPDDKVAFAGSGHQACSRLSPSELISGEAAEAIARMQSASRYLRSLNKRQPRGQNNDQAEKELGNDEHQ